MRYTALVTRMYAMAEEHLEVIVDDVEDFTDFSDRLLSVFRITDYRANLQARRLFEDTTLTKELSYDELQHIRKAVYLLFPDVRLPKALNLNASASWSEDEQKGKGGLQFTKSLPEGEILKVFLHDISPEEDTQEAISQIYCLIDSRLDFTNKRQLAFTKYLRSLDMNTQIKLNMILAILYKQTEVSTVIERLKGEPVEESSHVL